MLQHHQLRFCCSSRTETEDCLAVWIDLQWRCIPRCRGCNGSCSAFSTVLERWFAGARTSDSLIFAQVQLQKSHIQSHYFVYLKPGASRCAELLWRGWRFPCVWSRIPRCWGSEGCIESWTGMMTILQSQSLRTCFSSGPDAWLNSAFRRATAVSSLWARTSLCHHLVRVPSWASQPVSILQDHAYRSHSQPAPAILYSYWPSAPPQAVQLQHSANPQSSNWGWSAHPNSSLVSQAWISSLWSLSLQAYSYSTNHDCQYPATSAFSCSPMLWTISQPHSEWFHSTVHPSEQYLPYWFLEPDISILCLQFNFWITWFKRLETSTLSIEFLSAPWWSWNQVSSLRDGAFCCSMFVLSYHWIFAVFHRLLRLVLLKLSAVDSQRIMIF